MPTLPCKTTKFYYNMLESNCTSESILEKCLPYEVFLKENWVLLRPTKTDQ